MLQTSPQMTFSNFVLAVKNFIGLEISFESLLADNSHTTRSLISTENQERYYKICFAMWS